MNRVLIAGLMCTALAILTAVLGGPALLAVLMLGIGIGLKIAFFFALP